MRTTRCSGHLSCHAHPTLPCMPPAMRTPCHACPTPLRMPPCHACPPPWTDRHLWKHYLRKLRLQVIMTTGSNAHRGLMDILHRHNRWWSHDEVTLPSVGVVVAYHHTNQGPPASDPPFDYLVIIVIDCNPRIMSVLNWWHRYVLFIERLRVTRTTRSEWITQEKSCTCHLLFKQKVKEAIFLHLLYTLTNVLLYFVVLILSFSFTFQ